MFLQVSKTVVHSTKRTTLQLRTLSSSSHCFGRDKVNQVSSFHLSNHYESSDPFPCRRMMTRPTNSFSTFSNKFWDIIQSGSLDPENPIIKNVKLLTESSIDNDTSSAFPLPLDFSRIQPHHIVNATKEIQSNYENSIQEIEENITNNSTTHFNLIEKLHLASHSLYFVQNLLHLLYNVRGSKEFSKECNEALNIINFRHETSPTIVKHLCLIEEELSAGDDETMSSTEKLRIIHQILLKSREKGALVDVDNVVEEKMDEATLRQYLKETENRLSDVESKFLSLSILTMEEHGQSTSPQRLLPLIYQILVLKGAKAKLLGHKSYGELCLDSKSNRMAADADTIKSMHDLFSSKTNPKESPRSDENIFEELKALEKDEALQELRPYFILPNVLTCLFDLAQSLFGVTVKEETEKSKVNGWHKDVRLFYVSDTKTGKALATLYLDPFKRKAKLGGAFLAPVIFRQNITDNETLPSVAICTNINPPMWDDAPIHLKLDDVVTLFHEFGHALQHMLAKSDYGTFAGAHCMEEDASEVVSQFMEYLVFEKSVLSIIARHYKTDDALSDETVEKIQRKRNLEKYYQLEQRIFLGQLELDLFTKFDPNSEDSIISLQRALAEIYCPHNIPLKGDIGPITEIFQNNANGKRVSQYRYLYSEVMSADAYEYLTGNEGKNLLKNGRLFRETVLEKCAAKPMNEIYKEFRTSDQTPDAFLQMLKLSKD